MSHRWQVCSLFWILLWALLNIFWSECFRVCLCSLLTNDRCSFIPLSKIYLGRFRVQNCGDRCSATSTILTTNLLSVTLFSFSHGTPKHVNRDWTTFARKGSGKPSSVEWGSKPAMSGIEPTTVGLKQYNKDHQITTRHKEKSENGMFSFVRYNRYDRQNPKLPTDGIVDDYPIALSCSSNAVFAQQDRT